MKKLYLVSLFCLSGCVPTFKLVYDHEPQMISREGNVVCKRLWFAYNNRYVEEAYDFPCNVILRREAEKNRTPKYVSGLNSSLE